jgi:hypothetical protein
VDSKGMKKVIREVCETAKKISREMGYIEKKGLETLRGNEPKPLRT